MSEFVTVPGGREILSPALVRNGWSRFHLLLTGPPATQYRLDIAQNPEGAAEAALFRDQEPVALPLASVLPGSGTALFRIEFWLAADAPVRRIKLEPQVYTEASGWIVYPMEGRVVEARVPSRAARARSWRGLFCADSATPPLEPVAIQDLRLAESRPIDEVRAAFSRALGRSVEDWCEDRKSPNSPEWFLPFRDWLLK